MAYRRKGITRSSTFKEESYRRPSHDAISPSSLLSSQPIRPSTAHRDSSLSSAYANSSSFHDRFKERGTMMDKRSQDFEETWNLQKKSTDKNHEEFDMQNQWQDARPTNHEHQLKASRDVAIATAAKAKLLLREIKTVKADLAFEKQRSCQLEEENKMLREAREKGDHPTDDDMIRLQLETLLAEKARLAHENSVYVRENRCLRETIEYHKLSMQDVVYLDEGIEEVAEVNPGISRTFSVSPPSSRISLTSRETSPIPQRLEDPPTYDNHART